MLRGDVAHALRCNEALVCIEHEATQKTVERWLFLWSEPRAHAQVAVPW